MCRAQPWRNFLENASMCQGYAPQAMHVAKGPHHLQQAQNAQPTSIIPAPKGSCPGEGCFREQGPGLGTESVLQAGKSHGPAGGKEWDASV